MNGKGGKMKIFYNKDVFRNGALCKNCFAPLGIGEEIGEIVTCEYCGSTWIIGEKMVDYSQSSILLYNDMDGDNYARQRNGAYRVVNYCPSASGW